MSFSYLKITVQNHFYDSFTFNGENGGLATDIADCLACCRTIELWLPAWHPLRKRRSCTSYIVLSQASWVHSVSGEGAILPVTNQRLKKLFLRQKKYKRVYITGGINQQQDSNLCGCELILEIISRGCLSQPWWECVPDLRCIATKSCHAVLFAIYP